MAQDSAAEQQVDTEDYIIKVQGVWKTYRMGDQEVHALRGVNLDVIRGEYLSIMGPSGSGKTTMFNMVGALDTPTKGTVLVNGANMGDMSQGQIAYLRCHSVGYIFQSFNLIPVMSALENVSLPMVFSGMSRSDYEEKAAHKLSLVGLSDRLHHKPYELSGGQQQRVAIARAMANDPDLILADEPTGNQRFELTRTMANYRFDFAQDAGRKRCLDCDHRGPKLMPSCVQVKMQGERRRDDC